MKNRYRFIALFWIASTVGVFAQQLDQLIETALENNAQLNALELKVAATKEGEIQAESWKNTSISSALFISEPETRTGPQKFQLSASQPIPAFGRITARTAYAKSLTDISYQEWVIAKRKLILEVAQLYYNYQVLIRQSALIEKHLKRLDQYISIATTKVTTGEASAVDVFQLKMRKEDYQNNYLQIQKSFDVIASALKTTLNTNTEINIKEDSSFTINSTSLDLDKYQLEIHPELIQYDLLFESVAKERDLNDKERLPGIGVGLNYINVANRVDLNPIDNGKDIVAPMLSLSLPIFNKTYQSKERQLSIKEKQVEQQKINRANQLQQQLDRAIALSEKALIDFNSQNKNLNLAHQSMELVLAAFQTNAKGIEKLLDIQQMEFNYEFKKIAAIGNYFQGRLQLEYLVNQ